MIIPDDWSIVDEVSGLKISVQKGEHLDRLHIERMEEPAHARRLGTTNRDFFFDKEGKFDGTGSSCCSK
jgi:hypothetical protein